MAKSNEGESGAGVSSMFDLKDFAAD